jgi:hypothetical protein
VKHGESVAGASAAMAVMEINVNEAASIGESGIKVVGSVQKRKWRK